MPDTLRQLVSSYYDLRLDLDLLKHFNTVQRLSVCPERNATGELFTRKPITQCCVHSDYQSKSELSMYFSTSNLVSSVVSDNASSINREIASSSKRGSIIRKKLVNYLIIHEKNPVWGFSVHFTEWHTL